MEGCPLANHQWILGILSIEVISLISFRICFWYTITVKYSRHFHLILR